jgi:hypothetical protein
VTGDGYSRSRSTTGLPALIFAVLRSQQHADHVRSHSCGSLHLHGPGLATLFDPQNGTATPLSILFGGALYVWSGGTVLPAVSRQPGLHEASVTLVSSYSANGPDHPGDRGGNRYPPACPSQAMFEHSFRPAVDTNQTRCDRSRQRSAPPGQVSLHSSPRTTIRHQPDSTALPGALGI